MAEGCDYVMPTVPMLDVPLSTHEITSVHTTTNRISSGSLVAFQNHTSVTSITSPPPCRKYTILPRSSSCNVLADITGSGGDIPQSVRRLQHEILVDTRQVHHSTSQPNGFNYGQETPIEISSLQLPKKSKLAFRRKSSQNSRSPLHHPKNSEALVKQIESSDVDLNAPNDEGDAPIHAIVRHKRKKRADLLLSLLVNGCSRVDVNRCSKSSGDTALHLAVMEEEEMLVKTLLTFGADVNPLNQVSQTPLDIAIDKWSCNIVTILVSVGGKTGDKVLEDNDGAAAVQSTLEPFDMPFDTDTDSVTGEDCHHSPSSTGTVESGGGCVSNGVTVAEGDKEEMVFSGGVWREVILRDLEEGKASSTLFERLNECINSNLTFSGSVSTSVDEAMALTQQQRELLRYRKTEQLQSSLTRPRAGSRVLCLDGGSVRGLIQIEVLRQLELKTGIKVTEIFDWIVGTSTGGILALGLVYAKKNLSELRQLYFKLKDRVFSEGRLGFAYNTPALEKVLQEEFGTEALMSDVRHPKVLITAVYKKMSQPELHFFNNCFEDELSKQLVWKVARYTSAAPLFFSEMDHYVDGAVLANNPCEYALTAINNFYRGNREQVACNVNHPPACSRDNVALVVSIGTGIFPAEELGNTDAQQFLFFGKHWFKSRAGPFQRVENLITLLIKALMESEAVAENCQSRLQQQGIPFFRFNPHLDEAIPSPEVSGEKLLNMIMQTRYQTMGVQMDRLVAMLHDIQAIMKRQRVHKKMVSVCRE